jgi:citrate synthase
MSQRTEVVFAEKGLHPTAGFYAASVYHCLGMPTDLFTRIFSVSRTAGWTAHVIEQQVDGRLISPDSDYMGGRRLPLAAR